MPIILDKYALEAPASDEDWSELHELRISGLFSEHPEIIYNRDHPDDRAHGHFPLLFKLGGKIIGTARLDLIEDGGAVRLVVITEALRHKEEHSDGYGLILMRRVAEFAKDKGVSKLFLNANANVAGFYEKIGFQREEWDDPAAARSSFAKDCVPMAKII